MLDLIRETPNGHTIFCDDIREEVGNKFSYIGVYAGEMLVNGPFPVALPKFGAAIHFRERPKSESGPVEIFCYFPGDTDTEPTIRLPLSMEQIRAQPVPNDIGLPDPFLQIKIHNIWANLPIRQPGRIMVYAITGEKRALIGSLMIREFTPPA